MFLGTNSYQKSSSTSATLTVTGATSPTVTSLTVSGSAGSYTLASTVVGLGLHAAPTGTVNFVDMSNGNYTVGSQSLGTGLAGLSYTTLSNPVVPTGYQSVVTADFNGDGRPDILDQGTILLGQSDGTFAVVPSSHALGTVIGDFNGDGIPDLIGASGLGGYVVSLGNGDGTFTPLAAAPFSIAFGAAAVGDFNGDGIADVAVVEDSGNSSVVLLGNGDGTFSTGHAFPADRHSNIVIVGDFNGDGKSDLAVGPSDGNVLGILLGNGDGTFTVAPSISSVGYQVVAGDFNGDGLTDLMTTFSPFSGTQNGTPLALYLSNGDGTFAMKNITTTLGPNQFATGDFNGDGKLDLAISISQAANTLVVFYGNGDGTFSVGPGINAGMSTNSVNVADFNGDGQPDIAVGSYAVGQLTVLATNITETAGVSLGGLSKSALARIRFLRFMLEILCSAEVVLLPLR